MPINENVKRYDLRSDELDVALKEILGPDSDRLEKLYDTSVAKLKPDTIVKGKVLNIVGEDEIADVGYKSDVVVTIAHSKNRDEGDVGYTVDAPRAAVEDESDPIMPSKTKT